MAEKRQESGFTVTDRRLFTEDGELRQEISKEPEIHQNTAPVVNAPQAVPAGPEGGPEVPPMPTAAEQKAQADAYRKSSDALDSRVEISGRWRKSWR